jgi:GAF domain-containing protein
MKQFDMNPSTETHQIRPPRWRQIWEWIVIPSNPSYSIEEKRIARLATTSLFVIALFEFIGGVSRFALLGVSLSEAFSGGLGFTFVPTLIAYFIARTKSYRAAVFIFSAAYSASAYYSILREGESVDPSLLLLIYVIPGLIVASTFLSSWMILLLSSLNIVALFVVQNIVTNVTGETIVQAAMIAMIGFLLYLFANFRSGLEKFRLSQVQNVNQELEQLTGTLEQRVDERTLQLEVANQQITARISQLEAVTRLSETIAQLQDLSEVFPQTTTLINKFFGFYHIGIFLIDSAKEFAILQAANSEGGKRMLARGHRLQLGTGVVGYAAQTGTPRIALDVGRDAIFFNNPDLPETRSEVALPLKSRGETIGILDVQSKEAEAFSNDDLLILTTLANQVAIAIENARLLTETRAALVQVQAVYDEFTRAEWSRTIAKMEQSGYRYNAGRIEMLVSALQTPEVLEAVRHGEIVSGSSYGSEDKGSVIAVPVKLRGEVIGIIHVESNDPSRHWVEDEVSLVGAVAERAAVAMENARLFQDARRRAVKEQSISEATAKISSAMNIENILHATAAELERVLGVSEVFIRFQGME